MIKKIRYGMVGGGQGAFIGGVHRIAARLDDHFELVAGAFSSSSEKSKASASEFGIISERAYGDFIDMAIQESKRSDGIEAVSIVTPNHLHFSVAKAFLQAGIHVICDKPITTNSRDARELKKLVKENDRLLILTYNYSGYPLVRQARAMVASGMLGDIRLIQVEYAQDWLARDIETTGQKQASWRTDPAQAGLGGCIGDIGTHAFHLASYVTGLKASHVAADLSTFVDGRKLDDNAHVLLRYHNHAKGMLWASQVASGYENALKIRVFGTQGSLEWIQEVPNELIHRPYGEPRRILTRAGPQTDDAAARMSRIPAGHPEGYLESFANIYTEAAHAIHAHSTGKPLDMAVDFPAVQDGLEGVEFIEACVRSSHNDAVWTPIG